MKKIVALITVLSLVSHPVVTVFATESDNILQQLEQSSMELETAMNDLQEPKAEMSVEKPLTMIEDGAESTVRAESASVEDRTYYPTQVKLSDEWLQLFKQIRVLANGNNRIVETNEEAKQIANQLDALRVRELENNIPDYFVEYTIRPFKPSVKTYNVNDLPADLLQNLNQYFALLLNSIHRQLGDGQTVYVNTNITQFAGEIADLHHASGIAFVMGHDVGSIMKAAINRGFNPNFRGNYYENKAIGQNIYQDVRLRRYGGYTEYMTEPELYDLVFQFAMGFFVDDGPSGYGHALSLIEHKTFGLDFHFVIFALQMHVIHAPENLYDPYIEERTTKYRAMASERDAKKKAVLDETAALFAEISKQKKELLEQLSAIEAEINAMKNPNGWIPVSERYEELEAQKKAIDQRFKELDQEFLVVEAKRAAGLQEVEQMEAVFNEYAQKELARVKQEYDATYGVDSPATIKSSFTPPKKIEVLRPLKTITVKVRRDGKDEPPYTVTFRGGELHKIEYDTLTHIVVSGQYLLSYDRVEDGGVYEIVIAKRQHGLIPIQRTKRIFVTFDNNGEVSKYEVTLKEGESHTVRGYDAAKHEIVSGQSTLKYSEVNNDGTYFLTVKPARVINVYRLYNRESNQHFYTSNVQEVNLLKSRGWNLEGTAWKVSTGKAGTPVYRVWNVATGERIFTRHKSEADKLASRGWKNEGIAFYTQSSGQGIYRLRNKKTGRYLLTVGHAEVDKLVQTGQWQNEGVAFYGVK